MTWVGVMSRNNLYVHTQWNVVINLRPFDVVLFTFRKIIFYEKIIIFFRYIMIFVSLE